MFDAKRVWRYVAFILGSTCNKKSREPRTLTAAPQARTSREVPTTSTGKPCDLSCVETAALLSSLSRSSVCFVAAPCTGREQSSLDLALASFRTFILKVGGIQRGGQCGARCLQQSAARAQERAQCTLHSLLELPACGKKERFSLAHNERVGCPCEMY